MYLAVENVDLPNHTGHNVPIRILPDHTGHDQGTELDMLNDTGSPIEDPEYGAWLEGYTISQGGATILTAASAGDIEAPFDYPHGWDGTSPPAKGWEWKGSGSPESGKGSWVGPDGTSAYPDLNHDEPIGPHIDIKNPDGTKGRYFPDGTIEVKPPR